MTIYRVDVLAAAAALMAIARCAQIGNCFASRLSFASFNTIHVV